MRRLNLWFASVALVLLLTVIVAVALSRRGSHSNDLRVVNKTSSLIIESVAEMQSSHSPERQRSFKLTLRNGYSQPVVAYSFRQIDTSVPSNSFAGFETNGATNGWALQPKATDTTYFSAPAEGEIVVTLAAVMLADGTGEGDTAALTRIREDRAGVKMAYDRIVPLLRGAATSTDNIVSDEAVQSLDNQISTLPDTEIPPNLRRGFLEGKQFLAMSLGDLRAKLRRIQSLEHRPEITKFAHRVDEIRAKLKDSSSR